MASGSFRDLYNRAVIPEMTALERDKATIFLVDEDGTARNRLRQTLASLGYSNISDAPNHTMALKKLAERRVSHIIFDSSKSNMPVREFLIKVLEIHAETVALPISSSPTVDDVFGLLTVGARGYIVKPYNSHSLDEAIAMATKGEPISESILYARNRNEALTALLMSTLGNLATVMRQASQFETAARDVPKKLLAFRRAADIARIFSDGGEEGLLNAIMSFCLEIGEGPASKLGRIRKRIGEKKPGKKHKKGKKSDSKDEKGAANQAPRS